MLITHQHKQDIFEHKYKARSINSSSLTGHTFIAAPFTIKQSINGAEYSIDHNAEMSQSQINVLWMNGKGCDNRGRHTNLWRTIQSCGEKRAAPDRKQTAARNEKGKVSLWSVAGRKTSTTWSDPESEAKTAGEGNQIVGGQAHETSVSFFC